MTISTVDTTLYPAWKISQHQSQVGLLINSKAYAEGITLQSSVWIPDNVVKGTTIFLNKSKGLDYKGWLVGWEIKHLTVDYYFASVSLSYFGP